MLFGLPWFASPVQILRLFVCPSLAPPYPLLLSGPWPTFFFTSLACYLLFVARHFYSFGFDRCSSSHRSQVMCPLLPLSWPICVYILLPGSYFARTSAMILGWPPLLTSDRCSCSYRSRVVVCLCLRRRAITYIRSACTVGHCLASWPSLA